MNTSIWYTMTAIVAWLVVLVFSSGGMIMAQTTAFPLPEVNKDGVLSVAAAINQRRSVRVFAAKPLRLQEIAQLLWSAQGITHGEGLRAAPSAGALYPLELYLLVNRVESLNQGIYHYNVKHHALNKIEYGNQLNQLASAAYGQFWIQDSAAVIIIAADYGRTMRKYRDRGKRYVHIEVGHAAQNIYLQATALGIGTTLVGAFRDNDVAEIVGIQDKNWTPLALLPLGKLR